MRVLRNTCWFGEIQRFPEESRTSSSKSQRDSRQWKNWDILKSNISFGLTNLVVKVKHLYRCRTGLSLKKICFKYRDQRIAIATPIFVKRPTDHAKSENLKLVALTFDKQK